MIDQIKLFFEASKLYIFAILAAILITAWLFDRHGQYRAGMAHCAQQQANAQAEYSKRKEEKNEAEKQQAVKEATDAANKINAIEHEKQILIDKLTSECTLSSDERMRLNEALHRLQGE